eukprot:6742697-Ditylum_brightwellii.AAC.1
MAAYNVTPSLPARILDSIPERESRRAKRACRDHEEEMSLASRDKSFGLQSQYAPYAETAHLASPTLPSAAATHTIYAPADSRGTDEACNAVAPTTSAACNVASYAATAEYASACNAAAGNTAKAGCTAAK